MPHPPVIETVLQSLRSYAPGRQARESVAVSVGDDGRRVAMITLEGNVIAEVTGDLSSSSGQHRCRVRLCDGPLRVSEATGIPPAGVGRVARALHICYQEQGLQVSPDEVIAAYDDDVRAHQTPEHDTVRLVAEDQHGEAWFIKVQLADRGQIDGLMTSDQYEAYLEGSQGAEGAEVKA